MCHPSPLYHTITEQFKAKGISVPYFIHEQDIDGDIFQGLTSDLLIEWGVTSFGAHVHILNVRQTLNNTTVLIRVPVTTTVLTTTNRITCAYSIPQQEQQQ
jgi:hypothetical protein